ncbi:phage tail protein I [Sphingomonas sp.]|jgi:phage tail P2-like protein|uniref:phage tail protein I n=1 Tax=Sphingomonas sp. TaxID=28214 RepID=UPI00261BB746|nr:phage tail protein I [Sphingomonas sp.]MDF2496064.1 hypothetical protein [Sphingomonas sp.]
MSLLPPNATRLERALEHGIARLSDVTAPIDTLVNPQTIAASVLPWLAFGLSVDSWDATWPEALKRQAVAESIALHRIKGTRRSVEMVLARLDRLATIVEWHEDPARLPPHVFEVHVPLVEIARAAGGKRASAAIIDEIIAEVGRVKPLREHLRVVQTLFAGGAVGIQGAGRLVSYTRDATDLIVDTSLDWDACLQTEQGEPLETETGSLLRNIQ